MVTLDYWILRTDYNNFALTYGCTLEANDGTCQHAHTWIWSRTNTLADNYIETARQIFNSVCVNITTFLPTPQTQGEDDQYRAVEWVKTKPGLNSLIM